MDDSAKGDAPATEHFTPEVSQQFDVAVGIEDRLVGIVPTAQDAYSVCDQLMSAGVNHVHIHRQLVVKP